MKDGFLKAAAFSPALRVADCTYNAQQILTQLQTAAQRGVKLAVFPEFCLTGYTCGDLFLQRTLQQGALDALEWLLAQTRALDTVVLVGLPLLVHGKLYNCAAVLCRGQLLGIVPKTYLPNYGEFYEKRQFTPGSTEVQTVTVCGQQVPFGTSAAVPLPPDAQFCAGRGAVRGSCGAPCRPPPSTHWRARPSLQTFPPATRPWARPSTAARWWHNQSARLLCGYLYAVGRTRRKPPPTWCLPGTTSSAEDGSIAGGDCALWRAITPETELDCQRMEAERCPQHQL